MDFDKVEFADILFKKSQQITKILYDKIIFPLDIEVLDFGKIETYDTPETQRFSKEWVEKAEEDYWVVEYFLSNLKSFLQLCNYLIDVSSL